MPEEDIDIEKIKSDLSGKIPGRLLELATSENVSLKISQICSKNGIEDEEKIEKIAYQIGLVILGKLPPEDLPKVLEKELRIDAEMAEKVYLEVNRLIFAPVKDDLAKLYEKEIAAKPPTAAPKKPSPLPEEPKKPPGKDVYREPVE